MEAILRLDPGTGKELQSYKAPAGGGQWQAMAASRDGKMLYLVAGTGWRSTMGVDVASRERPLAAGRAGQERALEGWTVIGDGYIYCLGGAVKDGPRRDEAIAECGNTSRRPTPAPSPNSRRKPASETSTSWPRFDAKTGKLLHERGVDITNCGGRFVPGVGLRLGKELRLQQPQVDHAWTMAQGRDGLPPPRSDADKGWTVWPGRPVAAVEHRRLQRRDRQIALGTSLATTVPCRSIVDDTIYAEPWGYDLHTGEASSAVHPITGEQAEDLPSLDKRSPVCASKYFLFGRSPAGRRRRDLLTDSGLYTFWHSRMNCFFDAFSGSGMMVKPPNAIACQCAWSLPFTIALGRVEWLSARPAGLCAAGAPFRP